VNALGSSIGPVFNAFLLVVLVCLVYAILGVQARPCVYVYMNYVYRGMQRSVVQNLLFRAAALLICAVNCSQLFRTASPDKFGTFAFSAFTVGLRSCHGHHQGRLSFIHSPGPHVPCPPSQVWIRAYESI
jgi:hypothetical protein